MAAESLYAVYQRASVVNAWDFDVNINAIEQWATDTFLITRNSNRYRLQLTSRVAYKAALRDLLPQPT